MGRTLFLGVAALLASGATLQAAESPLTAKIDRLLEARWAQAGVKPAAATDDAEFLRRVWLDLAGTIPPVSTAREFLDDRRPDKRQRLVEKLLAGPGYVTHFSHFWRSALLPDNVNELNPGLRVSFEAWLASRLRTNTGYDRMVREILTAAPQTGNRRQLALDGGMSNAGLSPVAFYQANENKPENLAGSTARLFLGVRLECAQCHNHPHASWKQEQFWAYAAFFSGTRGPTGPSLVVPKTGKKVVARFPDGVTPTWGSVRPPVVLADWMVRDENPYFARAAVNRVWAYFFGSGLTEPVDDLDQAAREDALLNEVAAEFKRQRYDLQALIRGIVLSRAYQLTSVAAGGGDEDLRAFARMPVRGLAREQVLASLAEATGLPTFTPDAAARLVQPRERPTEAHTSVLHALTLMNGQITADATSLDRGEVLPALAAAPFLDTAEKVEALYLASLSRRPRADESARLVKYVNEGGPSGDPKRALGDVFWALLNSAEFLFNH